MLKRQSRSAIISNSVRFDSFEVDFESGELYKQGIKLKLRDQSLQVLASLLEHSGQLVTRDELRHRLWPNGIIVDFDNSLNIIVARLREVLGDSAEHPRLIETLPKRGYRFIGHLELPTTSALKHWAHKDLLAYHEYIQGQSIALATPKDFQQAKDHYEKAIERNPNFVEAYEALAELYWFQGYFGLMAPRKAFSSGIANALRALEIDNTRAETHALLAQFHKAVEYNWTEVHREMELALRLDGDSPLVRMCYAVSELMPHGRLVEAAEQLEKALATNPLSLSRRTWLGVIFLLDRKPEQAIEEGRTLLELDPEFPLAHFILGAAFRSQGRFDDSIAEHRKAVELSDNSASLLGWLGLTLAAGGETSEAREILQRLHTVAKDDYVPPTSFAWIHLGLREIDSAFKWLDRAVEVCDQLIMPIKNYIFLDPIRGDPRFKRLLQKMHLDQKDPTLAAMGGSSARNS